MRTLNVKTFDRLRRQRLPDALTGRREGFLVELSRLTGLSVGAIKEMRKNAETYGCTPKGQRNVAAVNEAMKRVKP